MEKFIMLGKVEGKWKKTGVISSKVDECHHNGDRCTIGISKRTRLGADSPVEISIYMLPES